MKSRGLSPVFSVPLLKGYSPSDRRPLRQYEAFVSQARKETVPRGKQGSTARKSRGR